MPANGLEGTEGMAQKIPVLAADRVVHFAGRTTFVEALEAALSQQWIIVSPRMTVRLHRPVALELRLDADGTVATVMATPRYWRGSFLGMQIEAADPASNEGLKGLLAMTRKRLEEEPEVEEAVTPPHTFALGSITRELPVLTDSAGAVSGAAAGKEISGVAKTPTSPQLAVPPVPKETSFWTGAVTGATSTPTAESRVSSTRKTSEMPRASAQEGPTHFVEEPTQPGGHGAGFGAISSQLTEVSQPGLAQAWGVTDDGIWNQVFQGVTGKTPPPEDGSATLEGEFVPLDLAEVASVPLYLSARLLLMPDDVRLYTLMMALALRETTCRLTLEHMGKTGTILFRRGMVVHLEPPGVNADELLGDILLRDQLVTHAQIVEAASAAAAEGESLGVKLYEKGWLPLDVLTERLQRLREGLAVEMLNTVPSGAFRIEAGIDSGKRRDPVRVNMVWLLAGHIRRLLYGADDYALQQILDPFLDRFPRFRENLSFPREAVGITVKEQAFIESSLVGRAPLGALLESDETGAKEHKALMILLHHFGYLDWLEESLTSDGTASVEAYLERRLKNLKAMGHFDRLDVHWATPPSRLELGMRMVLSRFGPLSHLARHSSASARLCAQIVALCQESYGVLMDPDARRKHRVARYGESKMQYAARFLVRQATQLRDKGVGKPAVQMLESAIDLMPEEGWKALLETWKNPQSN